MQRCVCVCSCIVQNQRSLLCPASLVTRSCEYTQCWANFCFVCLWIIVFFSHQPLAASVSLWCYISVSFLSLPLSLTLAFSYSCSPSPKCTETIVKHWSESQALRRLRGSGLTDRWISPQAPRMRIVQEAFPSHWDPCGLRIPGFCSNNKASHTARRRYCSGAPHCYNCNNIIFKNIKNIYI